MADLMVDQRKDAEPLLKVTRNGAESYEVYWCHRTDRIAVRPIAMPPKGRYGPGRAGSRERH
jgi:hypothetical protein